MCKKDKDNSKKISISNYENKIIFTTTKTGWEYTINSSAKKEKKSFWVIDNIVPCIASLLPIFICCFFLYWGCKEQQARIDYLAKHETMDSVYMTKKEFSNTLKYYELRDSLNKFSTKRHKNGKAQRDTTTK